MVSSLLGTLAASGCGGPRTPAGPGYAVPPECVVLAGPRDQADTLRIALSGTVDPAHAPVPRSDSERMLFGYLYETLIKVDCGGGVHPGLASEWHEGDGGRRWTFMIRKDARFWDGSQVTAHDVAACWQSAGVEPFVWEAGVDSVAAAGETTLHIYLSGPRREVPRELSAPPFAVAGTGPKYRWPNGSSPYRIAEDQIWLSVTRRGPIAVTPLRKKDGPVLLFLEPASSVDYEARDLLEAGTDMMVIGDPDVIEYALSRPHLETVPLPWSRKYVLLSTTRVLAIRMGDRLPGLDGDFTGALARDAVPGVSRGHEASRWWKETGSCGDASKSSGRGASAGPVSRMPEPGGRRRIVYDEDDPVARSLAERIVGLGAAGPGGSAAAAGLEAAVPGLTEAPASLSAAGMPEEELEASLAGGDQFAYVIWLPLDHADPCPGVRRLIERADWLSRLGSRLDDAMLPLVDTRRYAIIRKGTTGLSIDWSGDIHMTGALPGPVAPMAGR